MLQLMIAILPIFLTDKYKRGVSNMYEKLSKIFMFIWIGGILAIALFQQTWLLFIIIPLFFVFWAWGMVRSLGTIKAKVFNSKKSPSSISNTSSEPQVRKEIKVNKKSWFSSITDSFSNKDSRFKR